MRRKPINKNNYPSFDGVYREITSVLRDSEGCMVYSDIENGVVKYRKTCIKDLNIQSDDTGRRRFNRTRDIPKLREHVVQYEYNGPLFMYCVHEILQVLRPVTDFSYNRTYPHLIVDKFERSIQPFCKESKQKYVNGPSNQKRTQTQLLEGSQGSRTRGLITLLSEDEIGKLDMSRIFNLFQHKCYKCDRSINICKRQTYQIDHMMPASGYWSLNNHTATLLCIDCNQRKKHMHPIMFYGSEKTKNLCDLLGFEYSKIEDETNILNDEVLFYFNTEFDIIIKNWINQIRKRRDTFKTYLDKEVKRIKRFDLHNKHNTLITKLSNYAKTL